MTGSGNFRGGLVLGLALLASASGAGSGERPARLQGLFCSGEAALDGALAAFAHIGSFAAAAELANRDAVVCTYVDRLHYLVDRPVEIGAGGIGLPRYRAALVGVEVGDRIRPVAPPVDVYFVTPEPPPGVVVERES